MRRLYLLRHAKSSWDDPELADVDRPLAPRGRKATRRLAAHLARRSARPELVLCSPSRRTRETLDGIRSAFDRPIDVEYVDALYAAPAEAIARLLRSVPDTVGSVMVIAHNPGLADLASDLLPPGHDRARIDEKFPTGALATLDADGRWAELRPGSARLVEFVVPRELG